MTWPPRSPPNRQNSPILTSVFCPGDVFWRGDHQWKAPVPDAQVGRWRGCGQKTLGDLFIIISINLASSTNVHHPQHQLSLFLVIVIIITIRLVWSSSRPLPISEHYPNRGVFQTKTLFHLLNETFQQHHLTLFEQHCCIFTDLFAEQVPCVLPIRQDVQLGHLWLRGVESDGLRLHAVERTLSSPRSHDKGLNPSQNQMTQDKNCDFAGYQWGELCRFLLHLLPKVEFNSWRILLPSKQWMVSIFLKSFKIDNSFHNNM